jgi:hypothetical protein
VLAELFLGGHALSVRSEVAHKVRPADLTARKRQMAIGPPAVGGHDRRGLTEQALGVVFVAVCGDVQVGVTLVEDAPQGAALTGGPPARLVHVHRPASPQPLQQVIAGLLERIGDPGEDRVDRAGTDPRPKQLLAQLDHITAADPVAHRQRRDRRLKARPKRTGGDLAGKPCPPSTAAAQAAHPLAAMLGHRDRDQRQLLDLVAHRLTHRDPLVLDEHLTALAAIRPVLDDIVDRPRRVQPLTVERLTGHDPLELLVLTHSDGLEVPSHAPNRTYGSGDSR